MIRIKRVYDKPSKDDGRRILVDRLWPRGLRKEDARIDVWMKDVAPNNELRKWFNHDPARWEEFKNRFRAELSGKEDLLEELASQGAKGTVTLLYGSKEERINNAAALKEFIESRMKARARKKAA